jgi:hypothetical protein
MDRSNARTMEFYRRIGIVDRVRALGYPPEIPMDVLILTRLCDPPLAVPRYPSVAECRLQIAACRDGSLPLEPYQLVSQNKLEVYHSEKAALKQAIFHDHDSVPDGILLICIAQLPKQNSK